MPVVLAVLDGWGIAPPGEGNAIAAARTPNMDALDSGYPSATLKSFGEAVGLPWQEMGNSEVGHLNIGAGRIVYQDLVKIMKDVEDGDFFKNPAFAKAVEQTRKNHSVLHLVGLCSEGGIHGHIAHAEALVEMARQMGVERVFVHMILDGRDAPRDSGLEFVERLTKILKRVKHGAIASLSGRYFAMDRNNHWERTAAAYQAMAEGKGPRVRDAVKAVKEAYAKGVYDEEFPPTVIERHGEPVATVHSGDAVIFFNFRSDRAQQLTKAFILPGIDEKAGRSKLISDLLFVTMTEYDKNLPVQIAYATETIPLSLGEVIAHAKQKQFRIAETEKFAHVTVFFSAGQIDPFEGEERFLIPSPPVASYDQQPEMSAVGITDALLAEMDRKAHGFYLVNFANADMVGHTANVDATIRAVETVDTCLGRLAAKAKELGMAFLITADHGNAEVMVNLRTGEMDKEHSSNPVPFILAVPGLKRDAAADATPLWALEPVGVLADVAPTVLDLMGIPQPPEMTGTSLRGII